MKNVIEYIHENQMIHEYLVNKRIDNYEEPNEFTDIAEFIYSLCDKRSNIDTSKMSNVFPSKYAVDVTLTTEKHILNMRLIDKNAIDYDTFIDDIQQFKNDFGIKISNGIGNDYVYIIPLKDKEKNTAKNYIARFSFERDIIPKGVSKIPNVKLYEVTVITELRDEIFKLMQ